VSAPPGRARLGAERRAGSAEIRRGVSRLAADLRELQISSIELTGGASDLSVIED
jgi:hypothetical protein